MPHLSDCKRQATDKVQKPQRAANKPGKPIAKAHNKAQSNTSSTVYDFVGIAG